MIIDYIYFGIIVNVISYFLSLLILGIKVSFISTEDLNILTSMINIRYKIIISNNSLFKRTCHFLLLFLPFHELTCNSVFIYNIIRISGINGIMNGLMAKDQTSFITLVYYKTYHLSELDK